MNKTLPVLFALMFTIFLSFTHSSLVNAETVSNATEVSAPRSYEMIKDALLAGETIGQFDTSGKQLKTTTTKLFHVQ